MEKNVVFAQRLRELREDKGLTQTKLADDLHVSRGSICYYESAERIPNIEVLAAFKEYFNVDFDYLLGYSDTRHSVDPADAAQPHKNREYTTADESVMYKNQRYILDTEAAQMDFLGELAESMDWPLYEHFQLLCEGKRYQLFFKKRISDVLEKIDPPQESELDDLRLYCRNFRNMLNPGTVFKALYYFRRPLYEKYLLRLSESTAAFIVGFIVEEFEKQYNAYWDYPFPIVRKGKLLFFREELEKVNKRFRKKWASKKRGVIGGD